MQVLAGSLDVEVGQYLHAGYLSVSPRSFELQGTWSWLSTDVAVMDVAQSLAMKSTDTDAQQTSIAEPVTLKSPTSSLPLASMTTDLFMLGVVVLFFAGLAAVYVRRIRGAARLRVRWWETSLAAAAVLAAVGIAIGAKPVQHRVGGAWQNRLPPPWLDVPVREYEDPQAATQVILHGLITQGLAGCPFRVEHLSAIQNQVAFPVMNDALTEGMRC